MIPLPGYDEGIARAPLLFLLGAVFTALALGDREMSPSAAGAAASLMCLGILLLFSGRRPARFLSYCLALFFLAFFCSLFSLWRVQSFSVSRGRVLDGGEVILERPWGSSRVAVVDGGSGRYLLRLRPDQSVMEGETLTFAGEAVPFRVQGGFILSGRPVLESQGRYSRGHSRRAPLPAGGALQPARHPDGPSQEHSPQSSSRHQGIPSRRLSRRAGSLPRR